MVKRAKQSINRKCTVVGCENTGNIKNGFCTKHYSRWRRYGDPIAGGPEQDRSKWKTVEVGERDPRKCKIDGCSYPKLAQGLCSMHYARWTKHGDPLAGGAFRKPAASQVRARCKVEGCDQTSVTRGMCPGHYQRYRRGLDVDVLLGKRNIGKPQRMDLGYIIFSDRDHHQASKSGVVLVHRAVMSEILGRPLTRQETVHHKDGNRANNDPSNLELFTSNHPSGQRVEELVEWAEQIIAKYGAYVKALKEN